MSDEFYVGDQWELEATITNPKTKALVNPPSVTVTVYPPGARKVTPTRDPIGPLTAAKVGEGVFEATGIELDEGGQWLALWNTTAPYKGTEREVISVSEPR